MLAERLEASSVLDKETGCRIWTAGRWSHGYGYIIIEGKLKPAHRVAYELAKGPIPEGKNVCHRCDVKPCINPEHLFVGTQAENIADRDAKGRTARGDRHGSRTHPERLARGDGHYSRTNPEKLARGDRNGARLHPERLARGDRSGARLHPERMPRGEANGAAKLTAEQVVEIRRRLGSGESQSAVARDFGVARTTVVLAATGEKWAHVEGAGYVGPGRGARLDLRKEA